MPSDAILAAWAGATGIGLDVLTDLAERARSGTPDWFMPWRQAEAEATILRYWSPIIVPGVVQTRGYMRSLFDDEGHYLDQVEEMITARLERQQIIGRVPVTLIIGQHVLRRPVGTPAVMAEQCARLVHVAERSGVGLHVLPDGVNMGAYGAFNIATGDGTVTVCLETVEDVTSTTPGLVAMPLSLFLPALLPAVLRG